MRSKRFVCARCGHKFRARRDRLQHRIANWRALISQGIVTVDCAPWILSLAKDWTEPSENVKGLVQDLERAIRKFTRKSSQGEN